MARARRRNKWATQPESLDIERVQRGWRRVETRSTGSWNVQPISADRAVKTYVCGGCGATISPGVAHLVIWRADGVLGEAADLADRRHWHEYCWRT